MTNRKLVTSHESKSSEGHGVKDKEGTCSEKVEAMGREGFFQDLW